MRSKEVDMQGREEVQTQTHHHNGERPAKRVRLSLPAQPTITTRQMKHLETALEVDHMILDFLTYQAIKTCFDGSPSLNAAKGQSPVETCLLQVDDFTRLFQHAYPGHKLDEELQFRRMILQLVVLLTQRMVKNTLTPSRESVKRLRAENKLRARTWIGDASRIPTAAYDVDALDSGLPLPDKELEQHRSRTLSEFGLPAEDDAYEDSFYGTSASLSLLDVLPSFMRVSAACQRLFDSLPSVAWMQLAAEMMLQSCLEQYFIFGASGSDAIDEAFAWGFQPVHASAVGNHEVMYEDNDPFGHVDADNKHIAAEWEQMRGEALAMLFPDPQGSQASIDGHLRIVALGYSSLQTEKNILSFLRQLSESIARPVLAQLETGQLDGMSKEETRAFIRDCGINLRSLIL